MKTCINCDAVWTLEEIQNNSCDACGYPNIEFEEDDFEDEEVIGYHCLGCGHFQATTGLGYKCDRCYGGCLDEIYA